MAARCFLMVTIGSVIFRFCLLCLLLSAISGHAQAQQRGSRPDDPSQSELARNQFLHKQLGPKRNALTKDLQAFNLVLNQRRGVQFGTDVNALTSYIEGTERALEKLAGISAISRAKEIENMAASIGQSDSTHKDLVRQAAFLRKQIATAKENVRLANNKQTQETQQEALDKKEASEEKALSKKLRETKQNSFWEGGQSTADEDLKDFVNQAKTSQNNNISFWEGGSLSASSNAPSSTSNNTQGEQGDFWDGATDSADHTDFEIVRKDGKMGVVSKYRDVLIPFKDWEINSFRDGIASVTIDSKKVGANSCKGGSDEWNYYAAIAKTTMVSKSGEYLTQPKPIVKGSVFRDVGFLLFSTPYDCYSDCRKRYVRQRRLAAMKCEEKIRSEYQNLINRYVNQGYQYQK